PASEHGTAERGGFEPPEPRGLTRFRVVPFQPGSRTSPENRLTSTPPARRLRASAAEERLQEVPAFCFRDAGRYRDAVGQARISGEVVERAGGTGLRVGAAVDEPRDAGL